MINISNNKITLMKEQLKIVISEEELILLKHSTKLSKVQENKNKQHNIEDILLNLLV